MTNGNDGKYWDSNKGEWIDPAATVSDSPESTGYACVDCLEWEQNSFYEYEGVVNTGICSGLTNDSRVEIEVQAGWSGGVVGDIETDQDFFCANFKKREA